MYCFLCCGHLTVCQECPKGHMYLMSEVSENDFCNHVPELACSHPQQSGSTTCQQCGSHIGNMSHTTFRYDSEVHVTRR